MENIKSQKRVRGFGEVFTPASLVNEMLDTLPVSIWKNPNLKWLDNSCGIGNFLVEVKRRLCEHHPEGHVQKMIYGIDIQKDNVEETRVRTGSPNIVCADGLSFNYWNTEFDVIVGNPPYNKDKGEKKGNTCNPLWPDFVEESLKNLATDGHLVFVHPPLWRKPDHKILKLFSNYQLTHIKMFDIDASMVIFNCGTKVDYYCLRKSKPTKPTIIVDELGIKHTADVSKVGFIPNHSITEVYKLFSGATAKEVIYNCVYHHYSSKLVSKTKTKEFKHPCIYLANKKEIIYYYSKSKAGHFGIPKVIVPMGSFQPILDDKGKYGMCEVTFAIPIDSKIEGEKIMAAFASAEFKKLLNACRWKTFQLDWRLFKYLNSDFYNNI
jgi:hypothetical protein